MKLKTILGDMKSLQNNQEASMQTLQGSYTDHEGSVIQQLCLNINTTVDAFADSTVSLSDENEQYIKAELCRNVNSILNAFDNRSVKELSHMNDAVISIKGSITNSINKCISLQNDLTQFYKIIHKIGDNKELLLIASMKCGQKLRQALAVLGKSDNVFSVLGKSEHNVRIPSDSDSIQCRIIAICALPDGQFLVADNINKKVKLLNKQCQVVSHLGVTALPLDMCQITPSEVAVIVNDVNTHEVQFITVKQSLLVPERKFQLKHACTGIAHNQGDLFIASGRALFKYTLCGKQVCRLYEDVSYEKTVEKCAVSPTGDKLYIASYWQNKLLTLARDGTLLAILTDQNLGEPSGLHVTPAGQVLVCGWMSHTILQVDGEGKRKLTIVAKGERDGVEDPESVCFSSTTSSIIVGQSRDIILVFKVE
ncbi:uncharacterized protein LOC127858383 [Dreissena polymorpha]|nr:uncharacterized protein LOC127858383 [Dreissena polymorpha]